MKDDGVSLFEFICPATITINVRGEALEISPLVVRELPPFARAAGPIVGCVQQALAALQVPSEQLPEALASVLVDTIGNHGDSLIEAVALGARMPVEKVGELRADELIALAAVVIEVNRDFFGRAAPAIKRGMAQIREKLPTTA